MSHKKVWEEAEKAGYTPNFSGKSPSVAKAINKAKKSNKKTIKNLESDWNSK